MYFNDVNIIYYIIIGTIGIFVGGFIDYCNKCFLGEKKILSKVSFFEYKKTNKTNYILMLIIAILYIAILYCFGIHKELYKNLGLIQYMILIPALIVAFVVDFKIQIIPNRLNLLLFEIGLIFAFLYGFSNINVAINMFFGMVIGAGIFFLITLIGGAIAGKEAMGFGDVKFMGALGLYFGWTSIIGISVMSFLIGAVVSIILMCMKTKKSGEYIAFGPFIVIASFITIFIPFNIIFTVLMEIFSLGLY